MVVVSGPIEVVAIIASAASPFVSNFVRWPSPRLWSSSGDVWPIAAGTCNSAEPSAYIVIWLAAGLSPRDLLILSSSHIIPLYITMSNKIATVVAPSMTTPSIALRPIQTQSIPATLGYVVGISQVIVMFTAATIPIISVCVVFAIFMTAMSATTVLDLRSSAFVARVWSPVERRKYWRCWWRDYDCSWNGARHDGSVIDL